MKINFLEIAQIELYDAIEFYNYEIPGLGDAFLTEVLNALDRIGEFPKAWHCISKRTRRCKTRRFPYGIIYQSIVLSTLLINRIQGHQTFR